MSDRAEVQEGRVVLVSLHYYESKRRAGFHWLADAFWELGWEVTFATVALSQLSRMRRDHRLKYPVRAEANRLKEVRPRLRSYVLMTLFHPASLRLKPLNWLSTPLMRRYANAALGALEGEITRADLIVFESTPGLMFVDRFKRLNDRARYVYRVSDDLRYLGVHPVVVRAERELAGQFDLISVPSEGIQRLFPGVPTVRLHHHAINKAMFDELRPNPFASTPGRNAIFVGVADFDHEFLRLALETSPEWNFHVVGPIAGLPNHPHVVAHGELPFDETVAFIQHADAGLNTLAYRPGVEARSDSLKVIQYTYCRLPLIAPSFVGVSRNNVIHYTPGDRASVRAALAAAAAMDRTAIDISGVHSWDELAMELARP